MALDHHCSAETEMWATSGSTHAILSSLADTLKEVLKE